MAFGSNVVLLPVALRPILGESGLLSPILAGAATAVSSVSVVTNSLRLRRFRPPVPEGPMPEDDRVPTAVEAAGGRGE